MNRAAQLITVVMKPNSTLRGTTYFEPTHMDVSSGLAAFLLAEGDAWTPEQFKAQAQESGPTLGYRLNEGERIMIRRALVLYAAHFQEQERQHRKAGDDYNAAYDKARIEATNRLSEKILKGGVK